MTIKELKESLSAYPEGMEVKLHNGPSLFDDRKCTKDIHRPRLFIESKDGSCLSELEDSMGCNPGRSIVSLVGNDNLIVLL